MSRQSWLPGVSFAPGPQPIEVGQRDPDFQRRPVGFMPTITTGGYDELGIWWDHVHGAERPYGGHVVAVTRGECHADCYWVQFDDAGSAADRADSDPHPLLWEGDQA